jgi:hypothetical protein
MKRADLTAVASADMSSPLNSCCFFKSKGQAALQSHSEAQMEPSYGRSISSSISATANTTSLLHKLHIPAMAPALTHLLPRHAASINKQASKKLM